MAASDLTAERLRELLHYDPETGIFRNRIQRNPRAMAGAIAGRLSTNGRPQIQLEGKKYKVSRLVFLYQTGGWPENDVDHKDGDPSNNRWSNLRDVTHAVNLQNQHHARSNSNFGLLGVAKHRSKWVARLYSQGRNLYLGSFDSPEIAHAAYISAKRRLHPGNML